jgi:hypothetical protein
MYFILPLFKSPIHLFFSLFFTIFSLCVLTTIELGKRENTRHKCQMRVQILYIASVLSPSNDIIYESAVVDWPFSAYQVTNFYWPLVRPCHCPGQWVANKKSIQNSLSHHFSHTFSPLISSSFFFGLVLVCLV